MRLIFFQKREEFGYSLMRMIEHFTNYLKNEKKSDRVFLSVCIELKHIVLTVMFVMRYSSIVYNSEATLQISLEKN